MENLMKNLIRNITILKKHQFWKLMNLADYLLIIVLLLSSFSAIYLMKKNSDRKHVEIYKNNELLYSVPINKDIEITIGNDAIVQIKDNRVRIIQSSCKNHLCEKQGWSENLPIVCVPNKIAVVIKNQEAIMITK